MEQQRGLKTTAWMKIRGLYFVVIVVSYSWKMCLVNWLLSQTIDVSVTVKTKRLTIDTTGNHDVWLLYRLAAIVFMFVKEVMIFIDRYVNEDNFWLC